jgi:hypothetical protein
MRGRVLTGKSFTRLAIKWGWFVSDVKKLVEAEVYINATVKSKDKSDG